MHLLTATCPESCVDRSISVTHQGNMLTMVVLEVGVKFHRHPERRRIIPGQLGKAARRCGVSSPPKAGAPSSATAQIKAGSLHRNLRGHQTVNDNPGSLKPSRFRCSVLRARDLFDENMDGVADHLDAAVQATADALRTASEA